MNIPVLKKNDDWITIHDKLKEEANEALFDIAEYKDGKIDSYKLAGELMDVIQVAVGALDKLDGEDGDADIDVICQNHKSKLKGRGWEFKNIEIIIK